MVFSKAGRSHFYEICTVLSNIDMKNEKKKKTTQNKNAKTPTECHPSASLSSAIKADRERENFWEISGSFLYLSPPKCFHL